MDDTCRRDLWNHFTRYGASSLVEKVSGRWIVRFGGYTVPTCFPTKKAAIDFATRFALATSRLPDHQQ